MTVNTQKITREFCKDKTLIFFPKTWQEAEQVQRRVFELGFAWINGSRAIVSQPVCVEQGLTLRDRTLHVGTNGDARKNGLLCHVSQFDAPSAVLSPQQQESLLDKFNDLSRRMEAVEKMIAEIHKAVVPEKLDKPGAKL